MFHWWCLLSVSRYSHKYVVLDCSAQLSSEIIINHVQDVHLGRRNYHYLLSGLVSLVVSNWMLPIHIGQWWPVRRRRKGGHMSLFFQASNRATDDGPAFNALLAQQCIQDDPAAAGDGHGFFTLHLKYKRIFSPSLVIIRPYYVFRRKKKTIQRVKRHRYGWTFHVSIRKNRLPSSSASFSAFSFHSNFRFLRNQLPTSFLKNNSNQNNRNIPPPPRSAIYERHNFAITIIIIEGRPIKDQCHP